MATGGRKGRNVQLGGERDLYDALMAELSRVGIAQRIRQARREKGLHQHEMADALHVHKNTVSNWESQTKPITAWDRLEEISVLLGVSHSWLIHGDLQEVDPGEELSVRVVDSLQGLEESQEDIHAKLTEHRALLGELLAVVERLEGSPSTQLEQRPVQDTPRPDSASIRPQ